MTAEYTIFHLQNLDLLNKFMKTLIIKNTPILLALIILCSCQAIDIRGQYVDDNAINQLQNKVLTKAEVEDLIGTPTIVPEYNKDTWYYVQRSLARRAWFEPKVIEQRIVEVRFNNDVVANVLLLKDEHIEGISSTSEYTQTYGTEASGIQKFVRNIGRFNKTTDGKNKRKKK